MNRLIYGHLVTTTTVTWSPRLGKNHGHLVTQPYNKYL